MKPALATPLNLLLSAALAGSVVFGFLMVPHGERLPVHWGMDGQADGFMAREWALLMPAIIVAMAWLLMLLADRYARPEGGRPLMRMALTGLAAIGLIIEIGIIAIGLGAPFNMVRAIALGMALLLFLMGYALPRTAPNRLAGIRLPSTLSDAANWRATHRLAGSLCLISALSLVAAALFLPPAMLVWWLVVAMLAPVLLASLYSLWRARNGKA